MVMTLMPKRHKAVGNDIIRECVVARNTHGDTNDERDLWFQFSGNIPPPDDYDCDAYLRAIFMQAMAMEEDIEIRGNVCKKLLSNLEEFQRIWNKWKPDVYKLINIKVDEERHDAQGSPGAICAFSGGVDATFSVWMHSKSKFGHRSQRLKLGSMIHGFDIPLNNGSAYEHNLARAKETLREVGVETAPIRTNLRHVTTVDWEDSFSSAIVATLSNFKNVASTCLIASSEPYDCLVIPWGSTPITDHLLSSGDLEVIHDGASYNRTEKVREISGWKTAAKNLRVCWEGKEKDRNCGKCEKCVRTKLNFLANRLPVPDCLSPINLSSNLKSIQLRNNATRSEWKQIYDTALKNSIEEPWVIMLPKIIRGNL